MFKGLGWAEKMILASCCLAGAVGVARDLSCGGTDGTAYNYESADAGVQTPVDVEIAPPPQPKRADFLPTDGGLIFTDPIYLQLQPSPLLDAGTLQYILTNASAKSILAPPSGRRWLSMSAARTVAFWDVGGEAFWLQARADAGTWNVLSVDSVTQALRHSDLRHVYFRQVDGGTAVVERTDAGEWIAHGMGVADDE